MSKQISTRRKKAVKSSSPKRVNNNSGPSNVEAEQNENPKNNAIMTTPTHQPAIPPIPQARQTSAELAFFTKVALFFKRPGSEYLQSIRKKNRLKLFAATTGLTFLISITISALLATALTTDKIDKSVVGSFLIENISSTQSSFLFFSIDLPTSIILFIYSFLFFTTYNKYISVFTPDVLKFNHVAALKTWAKICIYTPQILCVLILLSPIIGIVHYTVYIFSSLVFGFAALFSRSLSKRLDVILDELTEHLSRYKGTIRYSRMRFIDDMRVFAQVHTSWMTLNIIWALVIIALLSARVTLSALFPDFSSGVTSLGTSVSVVQYGGYTIIILLTLTSMVGAMRLYGKMADQRYFIGVEIVNKEFHSMNGDNEGYSSQVDGILNNMSHYIFEYDPTVNEKTTLRGEVSALLSVSRAWQSAAFSTIIAILAKDFIFGVMAFLALCFSYAFNDLVDYLTRKDHVCHPDRALPRGEIGAVGVASALLIYLLAIISIGSISGTHGFLSITSLIVGGILYTLVLKYRIPVFATPFWCALIAILFYQAMGISWEIAVGIWFVIFGRELVLDLRDVDADFEVLKRNNIAGVLGESTNLWSIVCFVAAAIIFTLEVSIYLGIYTLFVGIIVNVVFRHQLKNYGLRKSAQHYVVLTHLLWPIAILFV